MPQPGARVCRVETPTDATGFRKFERLKNCVDIVLVEGAGSPAEVNLRKGDIANMGFARAANVPVVLVGDIDRGGVIAQLRAQRPFLIQQTKR